MSLRLCIAALALVSAAAVVALAAPHGGGAAFFSKADRAPRASAQAATAPGKEAATQVSAAVGLTRDQLDARQQELRGELAATAAGLTAALERAGLDGAELNRRYNEVSEEAFLASLPAGEVRQGYEKLHAQVRALQDVNLAQDGKTRTFFRQQPDESAPEWVVQHALALEKQELPANVAPFVDQVSRAPAVESSDLKQLRELCGRQWPCIEHGAYEWIKANHQLSDDQFEILDQYKREG